MTKILVDKGSNVNAKDSRGLVPLQLTIKHAAFSKAKAIAKILIENNADVNTLCDNKWSSLHLAIKHNLLDVLPLLLDNGAKIDQSALTLAVQLGNPELCKLILSKDGITNFKPNPNGTSLLYI